MAVEAKFFDTALNDAAIATGGTVQTSPCLVPQGSTQSTRIGRVCDVTSLQWRATFTLAAIDDVVTPPDGDTVRFIWFVDHQANGAVAAVTDVLTTADFQAFTKPDNYDRFTILEDTNFSLDYPGGAAGPDFPGVHYQETRKYHVSMPLSFSGIAGAITEITSANLGLLFISQNGIAGVTSNARIWFTDV